jgi:predicted dehydrogenase
MESKMRVGIVGAGLQGRRRAPVLKEFPRTEVAIIAALRREHAKVLADAVGGDATDNWRDVVARPDVDAVMVLTPPNLHAEMSIAAMRAGKHVLCEKPLARTMDEAREMLAVAKQQRVVLKCGFNHRHHPGIKKAKELLDQGVIGTPCFIRSRYGIGARPEYETEWRADPKVVSGGQLMEQGIHAIDLARWFAGDFVEVSAFAETRYLKGIAPLEDNGFVLLRTPNGTVASIHSTLTQWKNVFSFEVFGEDGYLSVEGLGGAYDMERVILGKKDHYAPFSETITEFRGGDRSWYEEWKEFVSAIEEHREPLGSGDDGLQGLKLVFAAYESSRTRRVVSL